MTFADLYDKIITVEKLNILSNYLNAYSTALKNQPFQLIYIDAFAGTGKIQIGDSETYEEIDGSAKLALQSKGEFAEYIFIEKKKSFALRTVFKALLSLAPFCHSAKSAVPAFVVWGIYKFSFEPISSNKSFIFDSGSESII